MMPGVVAGFPAKLVTGFIITSPSSPWGYYGFSKQDNHMHGSTDPEGISVYPDKRVLAEGQKGYLVELFYNPGNPSYGGLSLLVAGTWQDWPDRLASLPFSAIRINSTLFLKSDMSYDGAGTNFQSFSVAHGINPFVVGDNEVEFT